MDFSVLIFSFSSKSFHRGFSRKSELDQAPGIGAKRKRQLIKKLGSLSGIRNASVAEIAEVEGMSYASAAKLKEFLGGGA